MKNSSPISEHIFRNRQLLNGHILNVSAAAEFLGSTEKAVDRRLVPFRRVNRRIIFVKEELIEFLADLFGCNMLEAKQNLQKRKRD